MFVIFFLITIIFLSQIIQSEEPVDQAYLSDGLKPAQHSWGAHRLYIRRGQALCFRPQRRERAFHISRHKDCNVCKRALIGQTGRIWRKKHHCDYECCENKMSSEEPLCFETREKNDNSFHTPCDRVSQRMKYFVFIFSTQARHSFSPLK